jgi:hypothetical protein
MKRKLLLTVASPVLLCACAAEKQYLSPGLSMASLVCGLFFIFGFFLDIYLKKMAQKRGTPNKEGKTTYLLVCGGLLVLVYLSNLRFQLVINSLQPCVNDVINNYRQISKAISTPRVYGKILPVDIQNKRLDFIYFDLPSQLRTSIPTEIGTIAILDCKQVVSGRYTSGSTAYVPFCDITLLDRSMTTVLARHSVAGVQPPERKYQKGDWFGERPNDQIVAYLLGLPMEKER